MKNICIKQVKGGYILSCHDQEEQIFTDITDMFNTIANYFGGTFDKNSLDERILDNLESFIKWIYSK